MHFPSEGEEFAGKIEKDGAVNTDSLLLLFVVVRKLSERTSRKQCSRPRTCQSQVAVVGQCGLGGVRVGVRAFPLTGSLQVVMLTALAAWV